LNVMCKTLLFSALILGGLSASAAESWAAASVDFYVTAEATGVVVYSGNADVCDLSGTDCSSVGAGCGAASVSAAGVDALNDDEKAAYIEANFPFAVDQDVLDQEFQTDTSTCNLSGLDIAPDEPGAIPIQFDSPEEDQSEQLRLGSPN
jgi:hypothetical protein